MKTLLPLLVLLGLPFYAHAVKIQILHTNDLHSYFEGTRAGQGGYARLKKLADELKAEAAREGIKTIFVDGGDFGEGTSYFMANEGVDSFRMLDALGIDVAVLGNHDYMQGGKVLADQMRKSELKTKIVSANFIGKPNSGISGLVHDMVTIDVDGVKIGIFGLTTAEAHYQYPILGKSFIQAPTAKVEPMEKKARRAGVDFLIALTHIGLTKDYEVVKKSRDIDLVVGGHSHTRLSKPKLAQNANGRTIPVVQTGANSMALGSMIIDVDPQTGKNSVESYQLHDIDHSMPSDEDVEELVEAAKLHREDYFGRSFDEVIGESFVQLSGSVNGINTGSLSCWGSHVAQMTLDSVKSDVALHVSNFEGEAIPAGPIRFGDMIDNFPHFRQFGDGGWEIVTVKFSGLTLGMALKVVLENPRQFGLNVAGAKLVGRHVLINGKRINPLKFYRLAMPSELTYALEKTVPIFKGFLWRRSQSTGVKYWDRLEDYIRVNSPIRCD